MTIKRFKTEAHHNPELKYGQTYHIIGAQSDCSASYLGRYFVVAGRGDDTYLMYLHDTKAPGGYDRLGVVGHRDIKFVQVDLFEA